MVGCKVNRVGTNVCGKPCLGFLAHGPQAPEVLRVASDSVDPRDQVFRCRGTIVCGLESCNGIGWLIEIPIGRHIGLVDPLACRVSVVYQSLDSDHGSLAWTWASARSLIEIVGASLESND